MKLTNVLFALSFLFLISCGDDSDPMSSSGLAEGTWQLQSLDVDVTSTIEIQNQTITSSSTITGLDLNYSVTLTDKDFTTAGSYSYNIETNSAGMVFNTQESVSNVSGSGSYTIEGDSITTTGAFFELEVDGMMLSEAQEPASAMITLSESEMVLTQLETLLITDTASGSVSTTEINSRSVWTK